MTHILYASDRSPYARTCRIAVDELGLKDRVAVRFVNPMEDPAELVKANPLGLIPCLVREDGSAVMESLAVVFALEELARREVAPRQGEAAVSERRQWGLAQGILDAAVRCVQERRRDPSERSQSWPTRWKHAVFRTFAHLDHHADALSWTTPAAWHVVTAYDYARLVFANADDSLSAMSALGAHVRRLSERPAFVNTLPSELAGK